jgi:6-phosphogluconolactonase
VTPPHGELELTDDVPGAFARWVRRAFAERPRERFVLACSGGPTARSCYERLALESASGRHGVDWSLVDVVMGDERCVAPDDEDANQRLVRESLLEGVGPVGSFRPMSCDDGPDAYAEIVATLPGLDVVHLGLGPDAHTASLFPGSEALEETDRLVVTSSDPHDRNPHDRMTFTLAAIARADLVLFTVRGEEKAQAVSAVCRGADVPANRVRAKQVRFLVDRPSLGDACF